MKNKYLNICLILTILCSSTYSCESNTSEKGLSEISQTNLSDSERQLSENNIKTEINVGTIISDSDLINTINEFNKVNKEYHLNVIEYFDGDSIVTEMENKMKMDIISGNSPDIIISDNTNFYYTLESKGAFADLTEYIDTKQLLPNIIDICTENDGNIYRIPMGFNIQTGVAKAEYGQDTCEIYSYKTMQDVIENIESDKIFSYDMKTAVYCTTTGLISDFTDFKNFTCTYNSPEFIEALEFYKKLKSMNSEISYDYTSYANGKAMVYYHTLGSKMNCNYIVNDVFKDTEIVMTSGKNAKVNLSQSISISKSADENVKRGAVEFIKYAISDEAIPDNYIFFPITKSGLEYCLNSQNKYEQTDAKNIEFEIENLNDEQIKWFYEYIQSANNEIVYTTTIYTIFNEETDNYINGMYTAQQCAEVLQSRIQLYLDEHSG